MAAISGEDFELEAMRKEDRSWHPCRVSLSSKGASSQIIVHIEDSTEEIMISDREVALARLRPRSTPLCNGECFHVKEGEYVLAMHKARSRSLFFDAVIDKAYILKHSNRVYCRCTFEIKWLNNPELGEDTKNVSSNSIMKLSNKGIDSHPVIAAFLNAVNPTGGTEVPSFLSVLGETNCKDDLHELLEKQIEEISKLADESSQSSGDILLEVKGVSFSGGGQTKAITSRKNSLVIQNNVRRSTRSQNKLQTEVERKKELEEKPCLSPLAARAALASLVQELPPIPKFSITNGFPADLPLKDTKKHIEVWSVDVNRVPMKSDVFIRDKVSVVSNLFQDTKDGMVDDFSIQDEASTVSYLVQDTKEEMQEEARHVPRSSVLNQKCALKKSKSKKPLESLPMEEKPVKASKQSEESKLYAPSTKSVSDGKLNGHTITRRLTRSAYQKEQEPTDEMGQESSNEKLNGPVNKRLPRSTKLKEESNSDIKKLEKSNITCTTQDMSMDNLVTPEKNEKDKRRSISSSLDTHMDLALERNKRSRSSSIITDAKDDQDEVLQKKSFQAEKKKSISLNKPVARFSPRLRFLPRTRSQKKS